MESKLKKISRGIVIVILNIVFRTVYRLKVIGKENIPQNEPLIFCGNHKSYLDPPAISVTNGRKMRFIAKEELRENLLFKFLCWAFESIYVKRNSKDIGQIKKALTTLKSGECLGIFPEGTRNGMEKNNGEVKNGAAYLALKTGVRVIPVGVIGEAKPFSKNAIIYGEPLDFSEYKGVKISKEIEDEVSNKIKNEIIKLSQTQI